MWAGALGPEGWGGGPEETISINIEERLGTRATLCHQPVMFGVVAKITIRCNRDGEMHVNGGGDKNGNRDTWQARVINGSSGSQGGGTEQVLGATGNGKPSSWGQYRASQRGPTLQGLGEKGQQK